MPGYYQSSDPLAANFVGAGNPRMDDRRAQRDAERAAQREMTQMSLDQRQPHDYERQLREANSRQPDINQGGLGGVPGLVGSKMAGEYIGEGLNANDVYDTVTKTLATYGFTPEQIAKNDLETNQKVKGMEQQYARENAGFYFPLSNQQANLESQRRILEMQPALSADLAKAQLGNIQAASGQAVNSLNASMNAFFR